MSDTIDRIDWEDAVRVLTEARGLNKTLSPSEVARTAMAQEGHRGETAWRAAMSAVRSAAQRLARAGEIDITQRGRALDDIDSIRGPIRLRLSVCRQQRQDAR